MKNIKKINIIIVSIALSLILAVSATLIILSNIKVNYLKDIPTPESIVIYNNSSGNNCVYEKGCDEFDIIYNAITKSYKQSRLKSITSGNISKTTEIVSHDKTHWNFSGLSVSFVYHSPQPLKCNGKAYDHNNQGYWYQSLMFKITNTTDWNYSAIAIFPPENSNLFVGLFDYCLSYSALSNFESGYEIIKQLI